MSYSGQYGKYITSICFLPILSCVWCFDALNSYTFIITSGLVCEPSQSRWPGTSSFLSRAGFWRGIRWGASWRGALHLTAAHHPRAGLPLPHPPTLPATWGLSLPLRCVEYRICPGGGNSIVGVLGSFIEFFGFIFYFSSIIKSFIELGIIVIVPCYQSEVCHKSRLNSVI